MIISKNVILKVVLHEKEYIIDVKKNTGMNLSQERGLAKNWGG